MGDCSEKCCNFAGGTRKDHSPGSNEQMRRQQLRRQVETVQLIFRKGDIFAYAQSNGHETRIFAEGEVKAAKTIHSAISHMISRGWSLVIGENFENNGI